MAKIPTNAPEEVQEVARAWRESAVSVGEEIIEEEGETGQEAADIRKFWRDRIIVEEDDQRWSDGTTRWIIQDNFGATANLIFYPDSGEWYYQPNWGTERLIQGAFPEALGNAEIMWTG